MVKAVDMDSAYINDSSIPISTFLTSNKKLVNNPQKYPFDPVKNVPIPNHNTTILSFVYMLLNALSNNTSNGWSFDMFYNYLNYLQDLGCSKELLDAIENIYQRSPRNEFPSELLDLIDISKDYSLIRMNSKK